MFQIPTENLERILLDPEKICNQFAFCHEEEDNRLFGGVERFEIALSFGDNEIGIVQSGSVNVESNDLWGNKSILSHVEAGQAFAETYALCGEPLMVDVATAEPCEILWLDLVPMLQQQNTAASWYPKFLHNLLLLSMQKNLALSQRIRCTTPKSARGRLLTYLSAQAVRAGSTHFSIPFDRQQLADYLNLDRSALSKELGKMRDDGLIRCRKNEFELCGTE